MYTDADVLIVVVNFFQSITLDELVYQPSCPVNRTREMWRARGLFHGQKGDSMGTRWIVVDCLLTLPMHKNLV